MIDDSDDDGNRSYDVFVARQPPSAVLGTTHAGDVYVQLASSPTEHAIFIAHGNRKWVPWQPKDMLSVEVLGITLYAVPCKTQGLKYLLMEEDSRQIFADVPSDMSTLAELVAKDCQFPDLIKDATNASIKRAIADVPTSPRRKRARIPEKTEKDESKGKAKATRPIVTPEPSGSKDIDISSTVEHLTAMDLQTTLQPSSSTTKDLKPPSGNSGTAKPDAKNDIDADDDESKCEY